MSRIIVCNISDDRMGRKGGLYEATQDKIEYIIGHNPQIGIDDVISWRWGNIKNTMFYEQNKLLLDNIDAARNGRAYKPFVIHTALKELEWGDYVIYTDCSPEMWNMPHDVKLPLSKFNSDVIKRLTKANNDILTIFVKWDTKPIKSGQLGIHTHRNFTLNRCMDKMGLRQYENSFMHASGMWCIRKTKDTMEFMGEWLKWNCDEDCASLGRIAIPNDYSFWEQESHIEFGKEGYKMGHRHDQSISGLLLNKRDASFVDILYNDISPYNFLQYMRTDTGFDFIPSNSKPEEIPIPPPILPIINVGDTVINEKNIPLTVFKIEENTYIIGKSTGSMYATTRDKIKPII